MKILLMCNLGMSTSIMKMKLETEAKNLGLDASVTAIPMGEITDYIADADAILLGPQIRFAVNDITKQANGKPVMVISPQDFGMMRADKVMRELLELMK